jgi:CRP/FNR family transcriptional regulator
VFDGGLNPASASALEPSTVFIIPSETVLSLVDTCRPALAIIEMFALRLRHLATLVGDLSFRNVISRLAKVLLEVAVAEGESSAPPRLTQDEMAAMVGSVRDVIGRALRHLEREKALRIERGRIIVQNPEKLKEMV